MASELESVRAVGASVPAGGDASSEPPATPLRSVVALLEAEPDFAAGVAPEQVAAARRHTVLRRVNLRPGAWRPAALLSAREMPHAFGVLVLDGLITRNVAIADRVSTQLVGPGDVLMLQAADEVIAVEPVWFVSGEAQIAVLDARFLLATQRWPWLAARLFERAARWADRAVALQAISHLPSVDLRLVALMWHLAERWGRVMPNGVYIPLKATHQTLGRLVGAQRPTVTLALSELRERDALRRHGNGWLVTHGSRELLLPSSGPGAQRDVELAPAPPPSAPPDAERPALRSRLAGARRNAKDARARAVSVRDQAAAERSWRVAAGLEAAPGGEPEESEAAPSSRA